jgi:hypothetical protein
MFAIKELGKYKKRKHAFDGADLRRKLKRKFNINLKG